MGGRGRGRVQPAPVHDSSSNSSHSSVAGSTHSNAGSDHDGQNQSNAGRLEGIEAVHDGINFAFDNLRKFIYETMPKCPLDRRQKMYEKMEKSLVRLVKTEMQMRAAERLVDEVSAENPEEPDVDANELIQLVDVIGEESMKRISNYEATLTDDVVRQNNRYIQIMSEMNEKLESALVEEDVSSANTDDEEESDDDDSDDDEMQVENEDDLIPTHDPVTRELLKNPVRNTKCGHIYGKTTISKLIKKNKHTRCPIPGCSNENFLRLNHLQNDPELAEKIKRKQEQAR